MKAPGLAFLCLLLAACAPTLEPAGPPLHPPALTEATDALIMADGTRLPLRTWGPEKGAEEDLPESGRRPVILALHGFNDYSAFFVDAGGWLGQKAGIRSYAYDQRGFGEAPHPGLFAGWETMIDDAGAAARLIAARHPGRPLYLLGASMGGAVALVAATKGRLPPAVKGLILAGPAVWGRDTWPFYQRWMLAVASHTLPWLTLTGRGLNLWPSDNIEMLIALGQDPLIIKETRVDAIHGLADLMDEALASGPRLTLPALILYGLNDQIIPRQPTLRFLASLLQSAPSAGVPHQAGPSGPYRVALYETGWHMLLRDLSAIHAWKDIAAWTLAPGGPLPSGADKVPISALEAAGGRKVPHLPQALKAMH